MELFKLKPGGDWRVYLVPDINNLNKDSLRLFCNLIAPSHQLMTIYVALKGDKK